MESNRNLSSASREALQKSAVWSRYLAIISIVTLGLSVLQTVIGLMKGVGSMASSILGLIISGVITFVMANNLLKFSSFTKSSMDTGDASQLNEGFYHLKIYFTIMGVLCIIILSLGVLGLLIGLLVAAVN